MESSGNVFKFQGSNMTVWAKHIDKNMSIGFRPNLVSLTTNMSRNVEKEKYTDSAISQRSIYGTETSSGFPVSMQNIGPSVSIFAQAISSGQLNSNECNIIEQALDSRRKNDFWIRAEKRLMYLKKIQIGSGDDSVEPRSNSSSSSDDCASTRTDKNYKKNVPQNINIMYGQSENIFRNDDSSSCGGYTRTEPLNPYQRQPQALSNMFFSQNNSMPNSTLYSQNNSLNASQGNMFFTQRNTLNTSTKAIRAMKMISQKDRFRSGLKFPSQRFNKSSVLHEEQEKITVQQCSKKEYANKRIFLADHVEDKDKDHDEDSDENYDIFLATTVKPKLVTKENSDTRQKRKVESLDDTRTSAYKKTKITESNNDTTKTQAQKNINNFKFSKLHLPVRKSARAKSSNATKFVFVPQENESIDLQPVEAASPEPQEKPGHGDGSENTQMTTSDVSMRPSFMKRKLDGTVRKNNSSDSLATDSPQSNIYSAMSREKGPFKKKSRSRMHSFWNTDVESNCDRAATPRAPTPLRQQTLQDYPTDATSSKHITSTEIGPAKISNKFAKTNESSHVDEVNKDRLLAKVVKKQTSKTLEASALEVVKKSNDTAPLRKRGRPRKGPVNKESRSRIHSFQNTDVESDCDRAATPRAPTPLRQQTLQDYPTDATSSKHITSTEIGPAKISNKFAKTNESSHVDELNKDRLLAKVVKKQTSKTLEASALEVVKKSNDTAPLRKRGRPRKGPVNKESRSRIHSFQNTDVESDCDRAATPRAPTPLRQQTLQDYPTDATSSKHITSTEIGPAKISNKFAKTNESSHVDELNKDRLLAKVVKKQTSKTLEASALEVVKKSNDTAPLRKRGRPRKGAVNKESRSRIHSFWKTDVESDCDRAATPRAPTPLRQQTLQDYPTDATSSKYITSTEIGPAKISNKFAKTNESSHVDEVNKDTLLAKVVKKQTSKTLEASETEVVKKANDTAPLCKRGRPRKGTATIKLQPKKK